jgi:hypothetical protein
MIKNDIKELTRIVSQGRIRMKKEELEKAIKEMKEMEKEFKLKEIEEEINSINKEISKSNEAIDKIYNLIDKKKTTKEQREELAEKLTDKRQTLSLLLCFKKINVEKKEEIKFNEDFSISEQERKFHKRLEILE